MKLPKAIICDLDGTLCHHSHRLHFVEYKPQYHWCEIALASLPLPKPKDWKPDWDSFYAALDLDKAKEWCIEILSNLSHYYLLFITGRPEKYWHQTIYWLDRQDLPTDEKYMKLFMRPECIYPLLDPKAPDGTV